MDKRGQLEPARHEAAVLIRGRDPPRSSVLVIIAPLHTNRD
jgi:hypothetical protein